MKKNASKAQAMVVITEDVHAKCFENPTELNRIVETSYFLRRVMLKSYLESMSFLVEIVHPIS